MKAITWEERKSLVDYYEITVHCVDIAYQSDTDLLGSLKIYETLLQDHKTDFYMFRYMNVLNEITFRNLWSYYEFENKT